LDANTINSAVTMAGGAEGALGRIDKYELRRELGEGGFGTVYLARDTVADVDVAVKGLPPEVKHNSVELESIRGNFALVKRLRHPNIVAVTDLHQALSVSYASKDVESKLRVFERDTMVVMDYAPGVTLAQWRRQFPGGKVPLDKAIAVVRQVASALDYAHGQKVLHRDVKPANVMVESSDGGKLVARVLDFGLAAEIRSSMGRLSREIRDTSGTRPYMAPEQWKGERQGPATDQYALAAMFYELVVGDVPFASVFDCGDPAVIRLAVTTDAPAIPADLPKCVRRALAVALAKKPEERFSSCGEFAAALEGKSEVPHGGARTGGAGKVIAALALVAAICVGGMLYHQKQERQQADLAKQESESVNGASGKKGGTASTTGDSIDEPKGALESAPTRKDVDAIYIEARVQMGACGRLDPSDGFKSRIEDCQKSFDRAEAGYDLGRWAEAALAFTNVVGECKTLIEQSNARDTAKSAAEILAEAIKVAQSAGAKEYASVRFSSATDLAKRGRGEFGAFKFSDATATYASAKSQFDLAAKEAGWAKQEEARKKREAEEVAQRAEAERREREAREAAERERRAKWRQGGRQFTIDEPYGFAMTMKWCPAGTFTMGSPTTEEGRYDNERQHQVKLTRGFWLGETEVTQGQWKKLMDGETVVDLARKGLRDDTVYNIAGKQQTLREFWGMSRDGDPMNRCGDQKDDVPVYNVSWNEAVEFCRRLTQRERAAGRIPDGYEYRLPTEAEWEYACRAGTTSALPNGCDIRILGENNAPALDKIAWYGGNSSVGFNGRGLDTSGLPEKQYPSGRAWVREIKGRSPNNWKLYDMIGNVWEWCGDWYGDYPYGSVSDPAGATTGAYRVVRGGGWNDCARYCRCARRVGDSPGFRGNGLGFRVALAPSH